MFAIVIDVAVKTVTMQKLVSLSLNFVECCILWLTQHINQKCLVEHLDCYVLNGWLISN